MFPRDTGLQFSCTVFVWFQYEGNTASYNELGSYATFQFSEESVRNWCNVSIKHLVKFGTETIWA